MKLWTVDVEIHMVEPLDHRRVDDLFELCHPEAILVGDCDRDLKVVIVAVPVQFVALPKEGLILCGRAGGIVEAM